MKVIVTQVRKSSASPNLPMFKHDSYPVDEYAGQMITADTGYEIGAVVIASEYPEQFERNHYAIHQAPAGKCAPCDKVRNFRPLPDHAVTS